MIRDKTAALLDLKRGEKIQPYIKTSKQTKDGGASTSCGNISLEIMENSQTEGSNVEKKPQSPNVVTV